MRKVDSDGHDRYMCLFGCRFLRHARRGFASISQSIQTLLLHSPNQEHQVLKERIVILSLKNTVRDKHILVYIHGKEGNCCPNSGRKLVSATKHSCGVMIAMR